MAERCNFLLHLRIFFLYKKGEGEYHSALFFRSAGPIYQDGRALMLPFILLFTQQRSSSQRASNACALSSSEPVNLLSLGQISHLYERKKAIISM